MSTDASDRLYDDMMRALRSIEGAGPPLDDTRAMRAMDRSLAVDRLATELARQAMAGEHMDAVAEWEDGSLWERFLAMTHADPGRDPDGLLVLAWHDLCRDWATQEAERRVPT